MALLTFRRREESEVDPLNARLADIRTGNLQERDQVIRDYLPYIARIASQATGRYVRQGQDDEFSVALSAFNEAIDRFDFTKGVHFLGFADTVIRRRLIDFFRSRSSKQRDIPLTQFDVEDDEENVVNYIEVAKSVEAYKVSLEVSERQDEIERFSELLTEFQINFAELVENSPKHADARASAMSTARLIAESPEFTSFLLSKKTLPLKQLVQQATVSRKTIERQRKYIIAVALILLGDFRVLQEYIL
ncbi:MAG: sigI [Bacilli bacterium]|nr:sigI [Bacilli bacterium]